MNQIYIDCEPPRSLFDRLACVISLWRRRAAERRQLRSLDSRDLRDIGIRGVDARREASKPFWRA